MRNLRQVIPARAMQSTQATSYWPAANKDAVGKSTAGQYPRKMPDGSIVFFDNPEDEQKHRAFYEQHHSAFINQAKQLPTHRGKKAKNK